MIKKHELIPSDIKGMFRVRALRDFGDVKEGDIGGYIEAENNLSHEGNAWVYENAEINGNSEVYGNADIHKDSSVNKGEIYD